MSGSLPPGVSQGLYNFLPSGEHYFDGAGQSGNWADPANWWNAPPTAVSGHVLVPVDATLNGNVSEYSVMALGALTFTINGTLTTTDSSPCESFMTCAHAVTVLTPGAALHAAGALITGFQSAGTMIAETGAVLTSYDGQLGREADGSGTVTIAGAHWTVAQEMAVGNLGTGTLTIENDGVVQVGKYMNLGHNGGASGTVTVTSGGTLSVAGLLSLGGELGQSTGAGLGTLTVGANSLVSSATEVDICQNSALILQGGTLSADVNGGFVRIQQAALVSGFGTIATAAGVLLNGTLTATGGTLLVEGGFQGNGLAQIGAGATLDVTGSSLDMVNFAFAGQNGTLMLATGAVDHAAISGFSVGDVLEMAGVNQVSFDSTHGMLSLSENGALVDKLHLSGSFSGNSFTLTQSGAGAMIGLSSGH